MYLTRLPPNTCVYNTTFDPKLTVIAKADSGASKHFWRWCDRGVLHNNHNAPGPPVALPDGTIIRSSALGSLPLDNLSKPSRKVQVFKDLTSSSLVSIGQLCDDGCVVTLTRDDMKVIKEDTMILRGTRNTTDGLWDVELKRSPPHTPATPMIQKQISTIVPDIRYKANVIIRKSQTKTDLAKYLHATCWSPSKSTFLNAINNGNFITWPGLTTKLIRGHLPESVATAKGHLDQEKKNLQSTKLGSNDTEHQNFVPLREETTKNCYASFCDFHDLRKAYLDLTGKFPHVSTRGYQYFLLIYDYDSNAILVDILRTRQASEIKSSWIKLHTQLQNGGTAPKIYILDNECSTDLKSTMVKHNIEFQLVPPDMHRRNAAEKAIRTWKNHFIAGLSSIDPAYPIAEWDRLVQQSCITLNLLRNARANPKLSAYAYLFGNFNFNRTPMAPPGTK
jgi:hypothetical protein